MAPLVMDGPFTKRQFYDSCDPNFYNCGYSNWDSWGRWAALAAIVVAFLLLAFAFSCFNNRRRRRRGAPPMYGTGWIPYNYRAKPNEPHPNYYSHQPYNGGAPAPPYSPPIGNNHTGNTFNSNDGYYGNHYGGQQSGIELQQPSSAYQPQRGEDPVYDAPMGPPPRKGDYIVH